MSDPISPPIVADLVATYYTDPLCSWSWAFEAPWRRLCYELRDRLSYRYVMGGLIADWQTFRDPLNAVNRPAQMAPLWFQVGDISGMPIETRLWLADPPASSYPACIAVKAAEQQGRGAGERYLRRLREAVMLEGRNIARPEVLWAAAEEVATAAGSAVALNLDSFRQDLDSPRVLDAFREDIKDTRYRDIGRFPTLIVRHAAGRAVIVVGYRPYQALREAVGRLLPDLPPERPIADVADYVDYWGSITAHEAAEALGSDDAAAAQRLAEGAAAGRLVSVRQTLHRPAQPGLARSV